MRFIDAVLGVSLAGIIAAGSLSCSKEKGVIVSNENEAYERLHCEEFGSNHMLTNYFEINSREETTATKPFPLMSDIEIYMNVVFSADPLELGYKVAIFNYQREQVLEEEVTETRSLVLLERAKKRNIEKNTKEIFQIMLKS